MKDMNIHQKLNIFQTSLKVEKGHRNNFGKYNYRNLADIFQAVKPLLSEYGCYLTVSDEIVHIGNSNYVKATVTFLPKANSPTLVDGPSAIISPDFTLSPTLTNGF